MLGAAHALTPALEQPALEYLARRPIENVYLTWLIEKHPAARRTMYVAHDDGAVAGIAFFGRQVVLAAENDAAIMSLASAAPMHHGERMIVAPRWMAEQYWRLVRYRHVPPRLVRQSQPLFAVHRGSVVEGNVSEVTVRRARRSEASEVAKNSAQMISQELDYDPSASAEFAPNIEAMIEQGLWWVGEYHGELCFFCNAGASSAYTLQLQGIWTPPHLRGKGLAHASLAQLCNLLLEDLPTLSLYVNDFNASAIALYRRTGFVKTGEFQTLLF